MPSNRPARRNRGAVALIDAVFPQPPQPPQPQTPGAEPAKAEADGFQSPQTLLSKAVGEIARRSEAERVCAWLAVPEGGFVRVAAFGRSAKPNPDDLEPGAFEALRRLERATDLGDAAGAPTAGRVSDASGLTAAVALGRKGDGEFEPALAVLALGGPRDALGSVRPRTLALLQEIAQQLDGPLGTLAALGQIRELGHEIRWLDRQAALGEMLGEIVHEIRNPLVSVKTFLDLLPSRMDDSEFLNDFRHVVLGEVVRLERLLDSVLRHAQPERLGDDENRADVGTAMETLSSLLTYRAGEKQIRLTCQTEPDANPVRLTPDALQQVLLNLTLNALSATPAMGEVRVRAYEPAVAQGHWVDFTVEDSGPGIPADARGQIFEAFATGRDQRPGGLGLAITKQLVEEAGGKIDVGEAPEGGARFVVRLPALAEPTDP